MVKKKSTSKAQGKQCVIDFHCSDHAQAEKKEFTKGKKKKKHQKKNKSALNTKMLFFVFLNMNGELVTIRLNVAQIFPMAKRKLLKGN